MNHQRFGWQDDDRSEMYRGRYGRGDGDRYRGRGNGGERYGQQGWRASEQYGGDEDYDDMDYRRGQERDEMGRFASRPGYQSQSNYGRGGGRYGGSYGDFDSSGREHDDMGRFTGRSNFQGRYRSSSGGSGGYYGEGGRERDEMGRFMGRSGYENQYGRMGDWGNYEGRGSYSSGMGQGQYGGMGYGGSYSSGSGNYGQERDEMGRFTSGGMSSQYGRSQGPHTGRGPKNYQRSEERIKEDVSECLENDGYLDASEIDVKVQNGIVTLSGSVESREDKRRAEQLAEDCPGVKDVTNQLRVTQSGRESGTSQQQGSGSHQSGQSGQPSQHGTRKSA
jgi:osmotically-inducible protein OsmY